MFRHALGISWLCGAALATVLAASACGKGAAPPAANAPLPAAGVDRSALGMFAPLPAEFPAAGGAPTAAQVTLGRVLYFDTRLSKNHDISCNTCHPLDKFGAEHEATSTGHKKQKGGRNAPTVFNAAGHFVQFWDGRAADVEAQAKGPILNPVEMAMPDPTRVLATLQSIPGYLPLFQAAFPGEATPITYDNVGKAIGAFERKLSTPSRWDNFLKGDDKALTGAEKAGLQTFVETGCPTCHQGALVGGSMFQKAGLVKPWPNLKDEGRFAVTKTDADRMFFKVPSLRNITQTAPYFHDGSVATLPEAIKLMARHQLGKELDDAKVQSIAAFLDALTGELPKDLIAAPTLPPSDSATPAPDPS